MRLQPLNRFGRWGVFQQPVKAVIGYSEKESSPFNGAAVDRSTHLCFELLQELERQVQLDMKFGSNRSVPRAGRTDRYIDETHPRITIVS